MAKAKDFNKIGNSAVSKFLSNTSTTRDTDNTHNEDNTHNKHVEQQSLIDNSADIDNASKEVKSKRLNLLIQPSLLEDVKKVAYIDKLSVNESIIRLIKGYTEQSQQQDKIKKYDEL